MEGNMQNIFQQNLSEEQTDGAVFVVQLLFKSPVTMPEKEKMEAVIQKHVGDTECVSYNESLASFPAKKYKAKFSDRTVPPMLNIMTGSFTGSAVDEFQKSQMWDCSEKEREKIFSECTHQVIGTDMLAAVLPALQRAALDMDFLQALLEIFPECAAVYFRNSGKLFTAEKIRSRSYPHEERFIYLAVNVRFFNIQGTHDILVDTLGMGTLFLPDIQYHFHGIDPNKIVNHAYSTAVYILKNGNPIQSDDTIEGIIEGTAPPEKWKCRYEDSLIQPLRAVIDIETGSHASGTRE
ncbi:DUF4261 domain-containing protein [Tannerella forsythia]|nr:DUF4261 domain-containing protein [Tannerella forsythia]